MIGCSALTLGFFVAAIVGGADDQLDPRRFAVFGATPRATAWATLPASVISVPVLGVVVVAAALATMWIAHGATTAVAVADRKSVV